MQPDSVQKSRQVVVGEKQSRDVAEILERVAVDLVDLVFLEMNDVEQRPFELQAEVVLVDLLDLVAI